MKNYPWKTRGIVLTAPMIRDVDLVAEFIEKYLAGKVNLLVLQTRYRYQFRSHPECIGCEPLSYENVKTLVRAAKKAGIRLIPKMNLMGHQSGLHNVPSDGILHGGSGLAFTDPDGLLRAYPQFDETPEEKEVFYSRQLCPSHPDILPVVLDLADELMDVFEADGIHIGCDEAFHICKCPRCRGREPGEVFGTWVESIGRHVRARGGELLIWADRFLDDSVMHYGEWAASANGTHTAVDLVDKSTVMCDWHYDSREKHGNTYPSVDFFAEKGFEMFLSPWNELEPAKAFVEYARAHDKGHVRGVLATTWCNSGELAAHILRGRPTLWPKMPGIVEVLRYLLEDEEAK